LLAEKPGGILSVARPSTETGHVLRAMASGWPQLPARLRLLGRPGIPLSQANPLRGQRLRPVGTAPQHRPVTRPDSDEAEASGIRLQRCASNTQTGNRKSTEKPPRGSARRYPAKTLDNVDGLIWRTSRKSVCGTTLRTHWPKGIVALSCGRRDYTDPNNEEFGQGEAQSQSCVWLARVVM